MTLDEMKALYTKANDVYNNNEDGWLLLTDEEFDSLERKIKKKDPTWKGLRATGAKVNKKVAVRLPYYAPSLSKVYPEALAKWQAKQKAKLIVLMQKLDGSALIGTYRKGRCVFLATRGDGTTGKDISFLIPHLNLPVINYKNEVTLRFEAVVKKKVWKKKWSDQFDNARQMANGLLNRRNAHKAMKDIDMVVLGVYNMSVEDGLVWARAVGFNVVPYRTAAVKGDLCSMVSAERDHAEYDIDGLVGAPPTEIFNYETADRPKWTCAFKLNDDADAVEVKVTSIIWQLSRNNRWTPKIEITPTPMKGVTVTHATAHNAEWMHERGIGVGATIKIVRSGDVIPKIVGVVKKAKVLSFPPGDYQKEGVHFWAIGQHRDAQVREIHHFFSTLGIENIARKGIAKLYDGGFTKVLDHIESYGKRMWGYTKAGMGTAMTAKIYADTGRVLTDEGVTLLQLMVASNCFESFGERKLQMIERHFMKLGDKDPLKTFVKTPNVRLVTKHHQASVVAIKGMGEISAQQFFDGLLRFKEWFRPIVALKLIKIRAPEAPKTKKAIKGDLSGVIISFTGYRDKAQEAALKARGAEIVAFGGRTQVLIYKAGGKASTKIDKARAKGVIVKTYKDM